MEDVVMGLEELNLTQLRELGYLLESFVDREVRGRSVDILIGEISNAMLELDEADLAVFRQTAEAEHGVVFEEKAESSLESTSDGASEQKGEQTDESAVDEESADDSFIQIRCHPSEAGLYNGDLIRNPKPFIIRRYPHARLTLAQAKELRASGYRWNESPQFGDSSPEKRSK